MNRISRDIVAKGFDPVVVFPLAAAVAFLGLTACSVLFGG